MSNEYTDWLWENRRELDIALRACERAREAVSIMEWYDESYEMVKCLDRLILELEEERKEFI